MARALLASYDWAHRVHAYEAEVSGKSDSFERNGVRYRYSFDLTVPKENNRVYRVFIAPRFRSA